MRSLAKAVGSDGASRTSSRDPGKRMTKTFSILDLVPTDVDLEELMEEDGSSRLSVPLWVCVVDM